MQLQIPTIDEIRSMVREELAAFSTLTLLQPQTETDEIGDVELAMKITGKAKPTIYDLVHKRLIPHSKQGKDLYFSRSELLRWVTDGKRKTRSEIAVEAENFS